MTWEQFGYGALGGFCAGVFTVIVFFTVAWLMGKFK